MMHRLRSAVALLILTLTLAPVSSGCLFSGSRPGTSYEKGQLIVQIPIPEQYLGVVRQLERVRRTRNLSLSEITVAVQKGLLAYSNSAPVEGAAVQVAFPYLEAGTWNVSVNIKDSDGYIVFAGAGTGTVSVNTTSTATVSLTLQAGDLNVRVEAPAGVTPSTGNVTLIDPVNNSTQAASLGFVETTGSALFTDLTPTTWPLRVSLWDGGGKEVACGEGTVDVLPGRTTTANISVKAPDSPPGVQASGSLAVRVSWEAPPSVPSGLSAVCEDSQIVLSWNRNMETDLAGYVVYRSESEIGPKRLLTTAAIVSNSYLDATATTGQTYWYWVVAYDRAGLASGCSAPASVSAAQGLHAEIVGKAIITGSALGVSLDGSSAYILTERGGVPLVDVSVPGAPTVVYDGGLSFPDSAFAADRRLYFGDSEGLHIWDTSNATHPVSLGSVPVSRPEAVCAQGSYAYVGYDTFSVVDVSHAGGPAIVGSLPGFSTFGMVARGQYVYVADSMKGLVVVDVTSPSTPFEAARYDNQQYGTAWLVGALAIDVQEDRAYVTSTDGGLFIFDVSDPLHGRFEGNLILPAATEGLAVKGDHAFVALGAQGVGVIDLTDRAHPVLALTVDTPGTALDVAASGSYVYVADGDSGVQVIHVAPR